MNQPLSLNDAKRIVIKIGSLLLCNAQTGALNAAWLESMGADIAHLRRLGKEVVVVSSGAVALGRAALGLSQPDLTLAEKQAAAACGQITLVEAWQRALRPHSIGVAQMLITAEDTEDRRRYLNARSTINTLLSFGVVPIINENDSITTAEIRYGDNDRLAARVAAMASADALILLSDIDGLYSADPKANPDAIFVDRIAQLDASIWAMAGESRDYRSTGGMKTKLQAAEIATSSGCHMLIASGRSVNPVQAILDGGRHSWFEAQRDPMHARKHWIANAVHIRGTLHVDAGAEKALRAGNSLLPSGVSEVQGDFARGDSLRIVNAKGEEIAIGLAAYPSTAAQLIKGCRSDEIEAILGFKGRDELVHRDDMVLVG